MSRLRKFLYDTNYLSSKQHGFTPNKSTMTAINSVMHHAFKHLSNNHFSIIIFIDFVRAFDCVNHDLLLTKLENAGVRDLSLKWFQSYLEKRSQFVEIDFFTSNMNEVIQSELCPINKGVFQGTKLACLLFNVFLNDLLLNISCNELIDVAYADDYTICVSGSCINHLFNVSNQILSRVNDWCLDNSFSINTNKTHYLLINPHPKASYLCSNSLFLNDVPVSRIDEFNFLGLKIDEKLSWQPHIESLIPKLRRSCYLFRVTKNSISKQHQLVLYNAYFASHLHYGIQFWGYSHLIHRVLLIQKRCLRIIFNKERRASCRPIFKNFKILTVVSIYILEVCCVVHSYANDKFMTNSSIHCHNTRKNGEIFRARDHRQVDQTLKIYNKLPPSVRQLNMSKFRSLLKKFLVKNCFYSLKEFYDFKFSIKKSL